MSKHDYQPYMIDAEIKKKLAKLAEYEALEEQRLLLKLPCNIGTTVYSIKGTVKDGILSKFIFQNKIYCIQIYGSGILKGTRFETYGSFNFYAEDIGETVFLTPQEAEKQLQPPYITNEEFVNYQK